MIQACMTFFHLATRRLACLRLKGNLDKGKQHFLPSWGLGIYLTLRSPQLIAGIRPAAFQKETETLL